jgi:hypothetical protein
VARSLASASSQYLEITSPVVSSPPFTAAYWFRVTNATALHLGFALFGTSGVAYHYLGPRGDVAGDPVQVISDSGAATGAASTSTSYSANTWHHACGVFTSTSSRTAYLDGGGSGTNTTSVTLTPTRTAFGRMYYSGSPFGSYDGRVAHLAIWNAALGAAEVAALAAGYHPRLVRPASLVSHSPTWADGPRIIYPQGPHGVQLSSGGSPPAATPWLYARQRSRIIGGGLT